MNKTFYITTPIYYPSGHLHLGHSYTTVTADVIARYKKMKGFDTYFLTGTDEHGEKIEKKAKELGTTPIKFVDEIVASTKELWQRLNIDYNVFFRTTNPNHQEVVQKIFSYFLKNGDIYKGHYQGWYCTPCESFWTETQLAENHTCPDCQREVYLAKEEAYFFKMSKYSERLKKYYNEHLDFIEPDAIKRELLNNFIDKGLEDLCVSRNSFTWGIPIKEDPTHVVYVWLDALTNYISGLGYLSDKPELFNKYWHNDDSHTILHLIGKEISRFHDIYWPIFLMALDLPLPTKILSHGWIVLKDGKMSKSKGTLIDPNVIIDRYGLDVLRYYLCAELPFNQDNLFSAELFVKRINNDLVNDLGNLLRRTINMVIKYSDSLLSKNHFDLNSFDEKMTAAKKQAIDSYFEKMDIYHIDEACHEIFKYIGVANKYIDFVKPWELMKEAKNIEVVESMLYHVCDCLRVCAILLSPILLTYSKIIFKHLGLDESEITFEKLNDDKALEGNQTVLLDPLLNRLDAKVEEEFLNGIIYK